MTDVELQALGESRGKAMHSGVDLACLLAWPMVTGIRKKKEMKEARVHARKSKKKEGYMNGKSSLNEFLY